MMARAIICCAALILGLLATIGATAQSASVCNGPGCRPLEKARPLDLMAFMRGGAQSTSKATAKATAAKSGKHRHGGRPAARPAAPAKAPDTTPDTAPGSAPGSSPGLAPDLATLSPPAALPAAAATAYAAHADNDVQVVSSDQLNTIDLAMVRNSPETVGATSKTDTDVSGRLAAADVPQVDDRVSDAASGPSDTAAASAGKPATQSNDAVRDDARDDSWMGRIWSAVGDGFVALVAMVRQLFG